MSLQFHEYYFIYTSEAELQNMQLFCKQNVDFLQEPATSKWEVTNWKQHF